MLKAAVFTSLYSVSYTHLQITMIDPWFIDKIAILVEMETRLKTEELTPDLLKEAKRIEFPDKLIASLNGKTEDQVKNCLLYTSHTVIAVAHRLNTIKNYDRIYVLNHGRIVEQGTHEELLSQQGEYCQMYQDYVRKEM